MTDSTPAARAGAPRKPQDNHRVAPPRPVPASGRPSQRELVRASLIARPQGRSTAR